MTSDLGYVELPAFIERLRAQRFTVERQARLSPRHRAAIDRGAFPIYAEKTAAGLRVLDRSGAEVFSARFPERTYVGFGAVPRLVVDTLLFIENRELLDGDSPRRNPAIEWDRLAAVLRDSVVKLVESGLEPARRQHARHADREIPACAGRPHRGRHGQASSDGFRQPARLSQRPGHLARCAGSWWSTISTRRRSAPAPASAR